MVVSAAEKTNIDAEKARKAGDKRGLEVDSDDEAGPAKKSRVDDGEGQYCRNLGEMQSDSDVSCSEEMEVDSDDEGPTPAAAAAPSQQAAQAAAPQEVPHHILLVENLPAVSISICCA